MTQIEITSGSRKVIATRNDERSRWSARMYVNDGETATNTAGKFKTEKGLRNWAAKVHSFTWRRVRRWTARCQTSTRRLRKRWLTSSGWRR